MSVKTADTQASVKRSDVEISCRAELASSGLRGCWIRSSSVAEIMTRQYTTEKSESVVCVCVCLLDLLLCVCVYLKCARRITLVTVRYTCPRNHLHKLTPLLHTYTHKHINTHTHKTDVGAFLLPVQYGPGSITTSSTLTQVRITPCYVYMSLCNWCMQKRERERKREREMVRD